MTGSGDEGTGDRDLLLAANEAAARIFRDQLLSPASPGPRDYLTGRGFGTLLDETPWIIGYAPARWTNLVEHLTQQGYARATLLEAGLACRTRRHTFIDRFRDRVTFGIRNLNDELVGFTARCAPSSPATVPKYLNTPTTPVYSKREAPFGIGEQQASMRAGAVPVLVEGPLDAVAVQVSQQEHGEFAGIALCGTALSAALVKHLAHLNNRRVVLAFDSDDAGALATERAECALAPEFQDVLAMGPDSGGDPAEILGRSGAGAVHARLLAAGPAIDRVLGARIQRWAGQLDNAEAKVGCLREAATLLARFRPADAARHAVELAAVLGLDAEAVTRELVEAASPSPSNPLALVTECPLRPDHTVSHPPANSWRTQRSSTVSA
jgi:DNA primase catalytic core